MTAAARIPVSVVVMTRDEAANIDACLASLSRFAEVWVVDSGSTDGTVDRAAAHGARVVPFTWNGRYPKKKQWCLDRLPFAHELVLFVDADERVTPALADEIALLATVPSTHAAWFIPSRMVVMGRPLLFGARYRKVALLRRGAARFPEIQDLPATRMWEVEGHYQPQVRGTVGRLRGHLLHEDRKPPAAWMDRHNRYSDWEAYLSLTGGYAVADRGERGWRRMAKRLFRSLPCRPLQVFLHDYILRLGLLDGRAGFNAAFARAVYYWMIDWKRAWMGAGRTPGHGPRPDHSSSSASPARALISSNARRRTFSSGIR